MTIFVDFKGNTTNKAAYVVDILPHLQVSDGEPRENLSKSLEHLKEYKGAHIVADSAFGSIEMIKKIQNWGGNATLAISSKTEKILFLY